MLLNNRHGQVDSDAYRYGYQGSEKDDEVKGKGNSYTTHFRKLDPRLGRWMSRDPKVTAYETPYSSMKNNPIMFNDIKGDTIRYYNKDNGKLLQQVNSDGSMKRVEISAEKFNNFKETVIELSNEKISMENLNSMLSKDRTIANAFDGFIKYAADNSDENFDYGYKEITEPQWLLNARAKMGINESDNCSDIIKYHKVNRQYKPSGCKKIANAWCASFVGYNLDEAGFDAQKDPSAQSYSHTNTRYRSGYYVDGKKATKHYYANPVWGTKITKPLLGAIGVKKSGKQWHVGFIVGQSSDGKKLYMLGGNQSDSVNITAYPRSQFKAFVVPVGYTIPLSSYDLPVMSGGSTGGSTR